MTSVTPNPVARYERLLRRVQDVHEAVSRLVGDLKPEEGLGLAHGVQDDLSALCLVLEQKVSGGNAGQ